MPEKRSENSYINNDILPFLASNFGYPIHNAEKIKNIKSPLLLFHGDDDDSVRFRDNGKVVFDNAPEPKKLVLVQAGY